jgi:signal transduction histidine kinase/CheY-like chemotaxis protein
MKTKSPERQKPKRSVNLIWISVAFSIMYWVVESIRDVLLYGKGGGLIARLFHPGAMTFWMRLMVVCVIVLFGVYAQWLRTRTAQREASVTERVRTISVLLVGVLFSVFYWILEAFRDVFVYDKGALLHQIFHPTSIDFWMRFLPVCIILLFSGYSQNLLNEHMRIQDMLKSANQKLENLDQVKSDFLSTVSHELRTPIAIMKEGVSLSMDERVGPLNGTQRKLLTDTLNNIDRLNRLVTDLLDLSKIEAGKLKLRRTVFDMRHVAQKVVNAYSQQAVKKGIRLELQSLQTDFPIFADEDKVTQIFDNLMSNALRFTNPEGQIKIILIDRSDSVECCVSDTGVGIGKESAEKLFTKFEQIGRADGPGYKGTGLGLSICKGLVEKHGGTIWVESQPGKGSKFSFTLKKMPTPRVLIVDDEKDMVEIVKTCLTAEQFRCVEAYDGESALRSAFGDPPDLVVLDMQLGAMSGYEVVGRLKGDRRTCHIPILIVSGYSVDERLLDADGSHEQIPVLKKPVRLGDLKAAVLDIFAN